MCKFFLEERLEDQSRQGDSDRSSNKNVLYVLKLKDAG